MLGIYDFYTSKYLNDSIFTLRSWDLTYLPFRCVGCIVQSWMTLKLKANTVYSSGSNKSIDKAWGWRTKVTRSQQLWHSVQNLRLTGYFGTYQSNQGSIRLKNAHPIISYFPKTQAARQLKTSRGYCLVRSLIWSFIFYAFFLTSEC